MNAIEYASVAVGVRKALNDMENWPERNVVKTVVGRVLDRLMEQFTLHDNSFDSKIFVEAVYGPREDDPDIPF